jgi:hypothetical protein
MAPEVAAVAAVKIQLAAVATMEQAVLYVLFGVQEERSHQQVQVIYNV